MKLAISQPTFLPWIGYFALIDYVDEFIFFDNVQFVKRSWVQRNKLKNNDKEFFITLAVNSKNRYLQKINEVKIDYSNFNIKKFLKTIQISYGKSKFFDKYFQNIVHIFNKESVYIVDLNINLINEICEIINIQTPRIISSNLFNDLKEKNVNLLKKICEKRNCEEYISTLGAKNYMGNLEKFSDTDIEIKFFRYLNKEYNQTGKNFIPSLSILDLLFNEGPNTLKILRQNFEIIN